MVEVGPLAKSNSLLLKELDRTSFRRAEECGRTMKKEKTHKEGKEREKDWEKEGTNLLLQPA